MMPQHMGGLPELALALGPLLLIAVFVKIARRAEDSSEDSSEASEEEGEEDDQPAEGRAFGPVPSSSAIADSISRPIASRNAATRA